MLVWKKGNISRTVSVLQATIVACSTQKIFVTFIDLPFNELSLVGLTLDPVDCPLSFSAMTLLVGSPG